MERDYRPSLKNYLEAGAAASNFFAKEVPPDIWSNDVMVNVYFFLICGIEYSSKLLPNCTIVSHSQTLTRSVMLLSK